MTRYVAFLDESDIADDPPTGFTRRGAASGAPASYLAAVGYGTPPFKRRQVTLTNSAADAYPAVSLDSVDADANRANLDAVVAVYRPASNALEYVHVIVRGQGSGTVTDGYQFAIDWTNSRVRVYKIASSVRTNPFSDLAITHAAGTWALYRFRANGGATTTLTVRTWAVGTTEPTTWGLTATDSSSPVTAAGWAGFGGYAPSGTKTGIFNFLSVATNGDIAVVPLMNVDYYAWLNSPGAVRRVLAEMSAVGYDSSGSPFTKVVNAYIANGGFTTKPWDTPPDRHYDAWIVGIPTLRQEMNLALSGRASVGFGALQVSNTTGGVLGLSRLVLDGTAGGYASTPGSAALTVTDLDIRAKLSMVDWTPAAQTTVVGKWVNTGNQRSFAAAILTGGQLSLFTTPDGSTVVQMTSTAATAITDGATKWVRWTLDVNDGGGNRVARFYTSDDGITWTQLGSTVTTAGATSVFDSTAGLEVGGIDNGGSQNPNATIYQAQVLSGIGGSVVASLDLSQTLKYASAFISPATGEKWTLAGTARIDNPQALSGVRDDWLRMKWNREYAKLFIGDESWPKHDFRTYLIGKLGQPVAPPMDRIEFPVADLLGILDQPLQTNAYSSGPFQGQMKPYLAGYVAWMEPVPISEITLEQQVHDGSVNAIADVWDDGISLTGTDAISAVDAGTNILSTATGHGMVAGYTVIFVAGTAPAPLVSFTEYFVISSGLSATGFKLSTTPGGSEINITGSTTGASFNKQGYARDYTSGTVTLAANPAGRILVQGAGQYSTVPIYSPAYVIADIVFVKYGLSLNFKDQVAFDDLASAVTQSCGHIFYGEKIKTIDAVHKIADGTNCWYGITPDGLFQVGRLGLPAATAVMDFVESDIKAGSLSNPRKIAPADRPNLRVTSERQFYLNGPMNFPPTRYFELRRPYYTDAGSAWPSAGIPLDDHPDAANVEDRPTMHSLFSSQFSGAAEVGRLEDFYEKTLGVFTFETRLGALRLSIGETISLTHPREGWKTWSIADPASPDNMATIDSTKAVVIGKDVNLGGPNPFPVKLTVFRQIPGYYPTADLN